MSTTTTQITSNPDGFVSLRYLVHSYCNDKGHDIGVHYKRYFQWAFDCYVNELKIFSNPIVNSVFLTPDPVTRTVDLPRDYIDYIRIGINIRGDIYPLGYNEDMILPRYRDCGQDTRRSSDLEQESGYFGRISFAPHYYNGSFTNNVYGIGGGFNYGSYNIDLESNPKRIILQGSLPTSEIVLEYKSTGISSAVDRIVPRAAVECIKHWMAYKHYLRMEDLNKAEYFRQKFLDYENSFRISFNTMRKDEVLDAIYESIADIQV